MFTFFKSWKQDLPAGLVVYLVAVPLCLGIALASETSVFSGLIAGIIGGIVIGLFSGSALGVSGPAAGLTAIVAAAIHELGQFDLFLLAVVLAGCIQIILGLFRLGILSSFFPNKVILGMLTAIGLLILFKQFPHAVGYDKDFEGDEAFFQPDGHNTFSELIYGLNALSPIAILIFCVSIVLLLLWQKSFIQHTYLRYIPGPLVVVIAGILLAFCFENTSLAISSEHRVNLGITKNGIAELFVFPDFTGVFNPKIYTTAFTLAIVASIETLLSLDAADKLDPLKRKSSGNRELIAQGVGNICCGLIGGLPVTQVVVRTSANVNAKAVSKLSTMLHGVFIGLTIIAIPSVFGYVPYASLAAILVIIGLKLAKLYTFISLWKSNKIDFFVFTSTVLAILFSDLLIGIATGVFVAVTVEFFHLFKSGNVTSWKKSFQITKTTTGFELEFFGIVTFLSKPRLSQFLANIPVESTLDILTQQSTRISPDIRELLLEFEQDAKQKKINITYQ